ncbi:MAG TPA: DUF3048 domain-containing protein [Candidatus Udaeobacter sp.]|nr:DUF3048 domain-containing protein [Candidatus Udaeobacter sp.]
MLRKYWPPIIILTLISLTAITGLFFYFYPSQELLRAAENNESVSVSAAKYLNPLDGTPVKTKADSVVQVVGIMIDNHPDARPESGVSKAKIVYEVPVEGGITRYFAIFDSKQVVSEVGPVRSARSYFLDWLQEYGNGLYLHSGGSPEALNLIKSRKIFDANEFFWGEYYWRSQDREAPHNLYTSSDNWQKIINQYGSTSSLFTAYKAWKYARTVGETAATSSLLTIPYDQYYTVTWNYNSKELNYSRSRNDKKEIDKDVTPVTARNILVQITKVADIANDDKGRKALVTVGSGDAIILKKGAVIYGTWKKSSLASRTRFYTKDNKEVVLVPGNTWVQVVPSDVNVEVSR